MKKRAREGQEFYSRDYVQLQMRQTCMEPRGASKDQPEDGPCAPATKIVPRCVLFKTEGSSR